MNQSNDSTMSSFPDLTEDSLDDTLSDRPNPLASLPPVQLNILSELKTLTRVAARDQTVETEDDTLADLDQLQLDLERLLSHCVLMRRSFQNTVEALSDSGTQDSSGGGTSSNRGRRKMSRMKRARQNSYIKRRRGAANTPKINVEILADLPCTAQTMCTPVKAGSAGLIGTNGKTPVKLNGMVSAHGPGGEHKAGKTPNKIHAKEGNRSSSLCYIPKNNSAEVFWQSVRVYVDHMGDTDVKHIEDMLRVYETETIPEVPPLGDHYTRSISDPAQLLSISSLKRFKSSSAHAQDGTGIGDGSATLSLRLKAGSDHIVLNNNLQLPNNLIDRIVSVLNQCNQNGDENEVPNLESAATTLVQNSKPLSDAVSEDFDMKPLSDSETGTDLVRLNGNVHSEEEEEEPDEILAEIHKCRNELSLVRDENARMVSCLLAKLVLESRRNKVKQKLDAIDTELCSIVRKMNAARNSAACAPNSTRNSAACATNNTRNSAACATNSTRNSAACATNSTALHSRSPGPQATPIVFGRPDVSHSTLGGKSAELSGNGLKTEGIAAAPGRPTGGMAATPGRSPLQLKIGRYRKRALLYLKMRSCIVSLLEEFDSGICSERLLSQFESSMDIDAYLLKHILEGEEISLAPAS